MGRSSCRVPASPKRFEGTPHEVLGGLLYLRLVVVGCDYIRIPSLDVARLPTRKMAACARSGTRTRELVIRVHIGRQVRSVAHWEVGCGLTEVQRDKLSERH